LVTSQQPSPDNPKVALSTPFSCKTNVYLQFFLFRAFKYIIIVQDNVDEIDNMATHTTSVLGVAVIDT